MFKRTISYSGFGGAGMITIFRDKQDIPADMEYIELNDLFFNQKTVSLIDERAKDIINIIDNAELISKYKIKSGFNNVVLDVDKLSAGCKTVLNVLYYPNKVFCLKECGNNALEQLYNLKNGYVYSEYAIISFDMESVTVQTQNYKKIISDYEKLKEWWENEE